MNKITFTAIFLLAFNLLSFAYESDFVFDQEYYQCENKWVVFPKDEESNTHMTGVVYLDRGAGFTFSYEGDILQENGEYIFTPKSKESRIIYRIPIRYGKLARLPEAMMVKMNIPNEPEWLHIYRNGEDETEELIVRGYHFNHVGGSEFAIPILLQAYLRDPHAKNLEFELSYAYNATKQYAEAINILERALKNAPDDYMFHRELGYAFKGLGKIQEAEKIYKKGISLSTNKVQQAEMAFNMAGAYYYTKNKLKFNEWAMVVRQYAAEDSI